MKLSPSTSDSASLSKFNQQELVRLILQTCKEFGYDNTVSCLEKESGYQLENNYFSTLRKSIVGGDWNSAELAVNNMPALEQPLKVKIIFLLKKQKYLEFILSGAKKDALHTLRGEIASLSCDPADLQELSTWLMKSPTELSSSNHSSLEEMRLLLCETLEGMSADSSFVLTADLIPKSFVLPPRRLLTLMEQAVSYQTSKCLYHNIESAETSLYVDHMCQREDFPCVTSHVFEEHTDEVWFVSFSHSGKFLASASKDYTCIIWCLTKFKNLFTLTGHEEAVSFLAWSPDDSKLLSCGNDHKLRLWNVENGACLKVFSRHTDAVTSCAWLPEGDKFVSSSLDKTIYLWNTDGTLLYRWLGARVTDLAVDNTGSKMIAVCHEKKIRIYDLKEKSEQYIQEENSITSLSLSNDSQFALVNISAEEIHLWDLQSRTLLQKYTGQKQGRFVIRSCFGGYDQNFIVSGSEDCNVYIWNRNQGKLIEALPGHTGTVNSVTWNPNNPHMFASASDDCTIRMYANSF